MLLQPLSIAKFCCSPKISGKTLQKRVVACWTIALVGGVEAVEAVEAVVEWEIHNFNKCFLKQFKTTYMSS